jgi:trk system potassium uptake protein
MKRINIKSLLKIAGLILIIISISFLFCVPVALIYSEPVLPFILSSLIAAIPGIILYFLVKAPIQEEVNIREGYLAVTMGWIVLIVAGTLPYFLSHTITGFENVFFETTSGFTTTGASILTDVEILPKSILFWRSMTHWVGGIGIILLVILILPTLKVGGYNLFSLESSLKQKILPKTKSIAFRLLLIYIGMTVAEVILLSLGDMNLFDSICHSFGSVATGGFSTKNTGFAGYSAYVQYVGAIFMFFAATSYVVFYYIIKRNFQQVKTNEEFWFYIFVVTGCTAFVTLVLYIGTERPFELSFRDAFFQVISQISCTGFASTDYMKWPQIGWFFMFIIMFAGGSTGSTTGGIKMARHLLSLKNLRNIFVKLQHPNAVNTIKLNGKIVSDNINYLMLVFILLYVITFLIGMLIMQAAGTSVLESAGASATSMAGIGPGLGASGNMGNYAHFPVVSKITMMILMLIGRLEIFTLYAIFTKSFWKN